MTSSQLPNYLRANRKRLGLSQDEEAFLLGTQSGAKVCRYERFKRAPALETAFAFEAIFRRPARELFCGLYQKIEQEVAARAKTLTYVDGETIRRMILRMEASPKLAILQSTIIPIRAVTPFARTMQYSLGRTMPLYARGLYWFFGKYSVYWGHNALVRVAPFMEHARLPTLPGKPPLGGTILSQDIVEAALLGRAGWDIEWDIDNGGSFDELPPNILAYGTRDRRWCQGNVQHFPFIFWPGMKFGHRLYFANGIFAYLAGPLLLVLMFLDFIGSMFSPMPDAGFGFNVRTLVVVFGMAALPRFLGLLRSSEMHRRNLKFKNPGDSVPTNGVSSHWAGWKFEVPSTLLELALSILTAPLLFYLHARFVLEILSGRSIAWKNQSRNPEEALSWSDAGRLFWPATLLGAIWLGAALLWAPSSVIALMPILLAWVGSIPLAVVTSNLALGEFLLNAGLFPNAFGTDERSELGELATSSARPCARVRGALESVAPNDEQFVARNERRT